MTISISVEGKVLGRSKRPFEKWNVLLQVDDSGPSIRISLQDLISRLVEDEVEAFHQRQEKRRLALILNPAEISEGAQKGKIDPGERELDQEVDVGEAIQTALHAFEDGLYYVFIDKEQIQVLDTVSPIQQGSHVTFVRLVALAGG